MKLSEKIALELIQIHKLVDKIEKLTTLIKQEQNSDYQLGLIAGIALYLHSFYNVY